jgi:phosphodiesterase/alkaline phosphatase D-like protein
MEITRRSFLLTTAAASAAPFVRLDAQAPGAGRRVFRHGVASGDPATDRVILWTRVTAPAQTVPEVSWELSRNPTFTRVVARGMTRTGASRDFTVKIDAGGLAPATTYYYRFRTRGEQSPVGRTRTLPDAGARRVRLAVASCSNLPHGYFNVYRLIADRTDLDAVLHLGDYIYEYPNGRYGDGTAFGRIPSPDREIVALADYRTRHAQYKLDPDLQEVHRQHPFIVVWDDHEISNNAWRDGAENHNTDQGEGDYTARRAAAVQSYFEWMPIREDRSTRQPRIYRSFPFGDLADLMMLDTRLVDRDEQADRRETIAVLDDPKRSLLGPAQEAWLVAELGASKRANVTWQLLGQQGHLGRLPPWAAASDRRHYGTAACERHRADGRRAQLVGLRHRAEPVGRLRPRYRPRDPRGRARDACGELTERVRERRGRRENGGGPARAAAPQVPRGHPPRVHRLGRHARARAGGLVLRADRDPSHTRRGVRQGPRDRSGPSAPGRGGQPCARPYGRRRAGPCLIAAISRWSVCES